MEDKDNMTLEWFGLAIGLATLSIEIYCLKFIQLLDRAILHTWYEYIDYIFVDPAIFLSMSISCCIIVISFVRIVKGSVHK